MRQIYSIGMMSSVVSIIMLCIILHESDLQYVSPREAHVLTT